MGLLDLLMKILIGQLILNLVLHFSDTTLFSNMIIFPITTEGWEDGSSLCS